MFKIIPKNQFDEAYAILENSFPSDEIRPKSSHFALLNYPKYFMYGYYLDDTLVGVMGVYTLSDFSFIEHFAVSKNYRNNGIGEKMLSSISAINNNRLVLEVEPPTSTITKRRVAFYERNKFTFNDYHYTQPPISKGQKPLQLFIMSTNGKLPFITFLSIRNEIYENVYYK